MKNTVILLSCVLLSGCATLFPNPGEAPKKFTLDAINSIPSGKQSSLKIMVDLPTVYPPLDNQRIAVVPGPHLIDYYADCEWGDRLGNLLQDSLVYSLQNSQLYKGVGRSSDAILGDYLLKTDVRAFYIEQKPALQAVTSYFIQLIRLSDRQVVSHQTFETKILLKNENLEEIISTLNTANLKNTNKILLWLKQNNS